MIINVSLFNNYVNNCVPQNAIYYFILLRVWWWSFHWSLSKSKSSQVPRTFLSILADLVWIISVHPPFATLLLSSPSVWRLFQVVIIIIINIIIRVFFTPTLADSLSLKFEWQRISSSPGHFSVFWPILIMLLSGCSQLVLFQPLLYRAHQLLLVSPSCSIVFLVHC